MDYVAEIQNMENDAKGLEKLFRVAQDQDEGGKFHEAMKVCFDEASDNLLFAAWYYRLRGQIAVVPDKKDRQVNWRLAVPLSILTGLIYWFLSDFDWLYLDRIPLILILWSPIATMSGITFLAVTSRRGYQRSIAICAALVFTVLYIMVLTRGQETQYQRRYLELMVIHIPLLTWMAIGISLLGIKSSSKSRFAFLSKSIEVMVTAGVYLIVGMIFGGITIGMFEALNIVFPELLMRLVGFGGFGLLPVLALASVYDPRVGPDEQDTSTGLSKFVSTMMRLLIPLTMIVLVIYLLVIPFNFMEPFNNRDVLIIYNVMLFAIMGLLIGATPLDRDDLSQKANTSLRIGILIVVILAGVVSIYALSATVFRTIMGGITINRLTVIGWNTINIIILGMIGIRYKSQAENWVDLLHWVFSQGIKAYIIWALFLTLGVPLLFR